MLLSKIEIENFRSIKKLTMNLYKKTVLVGKNNTGKSNILKAIDLVLGDKYAKVSKNDFYNQDENNDIKIKLEFTRLTDYEITDIKKQLIYDRRGEAKESLETTKKITIQFTIGLIGQNREIFFGDVSYKYISKGLKESLLSSVYIPAIRDHNQILKISEYSFFNKLLNKIYSSADESQKVELERALSGAAEKCKSIFHDSEEKLDKITKSIIDHKGLKFSCLPSNKQDIYKKLSLLLNDGIETELDFKGSGIQSAVIISMFKLYADLKVGSAVLLIEEPESFLHPHANRHMAKVFNEISKEEGIQIIFTTHSPYYLIDTDIDNISLVKKRDNETAICQPSSAGIDKTKLRKEMSVDNLELFFADKIVLVEGDTEKILLPTIAPQINPDYDFDRRNISIINVDSKSNFLIFLQMLNAYEKKWYVITDRDILNTESKINLINIANLLGIRTDSLSQDDLIRAFKPKKFHILSYGEVENYYSKVWLYDLLEDAIEDLNLPPSILTDIISIFRGFENPANIITIKMDVGTRFSEHFIKIEPILNMKKDLLSLDINKLKVSEDLKSILTHLDLKSKPRIAIKIKEHANINKMEEPKKIELTEIIESIFQ